MPLLVITTPSRIYIDVLGTYGGLFCVHPNIQLNDRKLTYKELAFAHRYVAHEPFIWNKGKIAASDCRSEI
jgi:hypothetical protein